MSDLYKIQSDANRFQAYIHATDADAEQMMLANAQSVATTWVPPRVVLDEESAPRGDCPCVFGSPSPCLSQRAVDALSGLFSEFGEFLPLRCDEEPLHIYNCTRVSDVLDLEASEVTWGKTGKILRVKQVVWRPQAHDEFLFRIPQMHHSPTFITGDVRAEIERAGLRGFLFENLMRIP